MSQMRYLRGAASGVSGLVGIKSSNTFEMSENAPIDLNFQLNAAVVQVVLAITDYVVGLAYFIIPLLLLSTISGVDVAQFVRTLTNNVVYVFILCALTHFYTAFLLTIDYYGWLESFDISLENTHVILKVITSLFSIKTVFVIHSYQHSCRKLAEDASKLETDAKEKEKVNKELAESNEELKSAVKKREHVLGVVSHELRTPLVSIIGLIDVILSSKDREQTEVDLSTIQKSANHLLLLVNDILDISKIQDSVQNKQQFNVANSIQNTISILQKDKRNSNIPVKYATIASEYELPKEFYGDEFRFSQILNNIITNAFKNIETGNVTVTLVACKLNKVIIPGDEYMLIPDLGNDDKERNKILLPSNLEESNNKLKLKYLGTHQEKDSLWFSISITDTGCGINKADILPIFNRFYQLQLGPSRNNSGVGLGLSICRKLVSNMNGIILVKSKTIQEAEEEGKEDHGTSFKVCIPWVFPPGKDKSVRTSTPASPTNTSLGVTLNELCKLMHIMVVDDDQVNLKVFGRILSSIGLTDIQFSSGGAQALEMWQKNREKINYIFMDYHMPGMDGVQVVSEIRKQACGHIPYICALTADIHLEAEKFGFDTKVLKPITRLDAINVLNKGVPKFQELAMTNCKSPVFKLISNMPKFPNPQQEPAPVLKAINTPVNTARRGKRAKAKNSDRKTPRGNSKNKAKPAAVGETATIASRVSRRRRSTIDF